MTDDERNDWTAWMPMGRPVKRCKVCREDLPITEYHRAKTGADGHVNTCRSCSARPVVRQVKTTREPCCEDCGTKLTRNRTVRMDGRALCQPCWSSFWGAQFAAKR